MAASNEDNITLRNFIYLDLPVVGSLVSQLEEGILEHRVSETSQQEESGKEITGSVKVVSGAGHKTTTGASSETQTFVAHHDIYNRMEQGLLKYGFAKDISAGFDYGKDWSLNYFKDSDYVLVRPDMLRFVNYADMLNLLKSAAPLVKKEEEQKRTAVKEELQANLRQLKKNQPNNIQGRRQIEKAIKELEESDELADLNVMADVLGDFLGIRLKIVPKRTNEDRVFVCNCEPSSFTASLGFIKQQYGVNIEGPWVVLGQVNIPSVKEISSIEIGSQLDSALEEKLIGIESEFYKLNSIVFPAISLTPISIYRETTRSVEIE